MALTLSASSRRFAWRVFTPSTWHASNAGRAENDRMGRSAFANSRDDCGRSRTSSDLETPRTIVLTAVAIRESGANPNRLDRPQRTRAAFTQPPARPRRLRFDFATAFAHNPAQSRHTCRRTRAAGDESPLAQTGWRREWDSNPRYLLGTHAFQACAFSRSAISPECPALPALLRQAEQQILAEREGFEPSIGD
jgi:hypothetical protein